MTPLETLQKYGLKTDVKSIRERVMNRRSYHEIADTLIPYECFFETVSPLIEMKNNIAEEKYYALVKELRSADLTLLCSLAEKGERYEKAVEMERAIINEKIYLADRGSTTYYKYLSQLSVVDTIEHCVEDSTNTDNENIPIPSFSESMGYIIADIAEAEGEGK